MNTDTDTIIAVNLTVHATTEAQAARVVEVLSRPLVGFALDDLYTNLSVIKVEADE